MKIYSPKAIRKRIQMYADRPEPSVRNPSQVGALVGRMNRAIKRIGYGNNQANALRRLALGYLCLPDTEPLRELSSKDELITPQHWNGISRWVSRWSEREGGFVDRPAFQDELRWILYRALKDGNIARGFMPMFITVDLYGDEPGDLDEFTGKQMELEVENQLD